MHLETMKEMHTNAQLLHDALQANALGVAGEMAEWILKTLTQEIESAEAPRMMTKAQAWKIAGLVCSDLTRTSYYHKFKLRDIPRYDASNIIGDLLGFDGRAEYEGEVFTRMPEGEAACDADKARKARRRRAA